MRVQIFYADLPRSIYHSAEYIKRNDQTMKAYHSVNNHTIFFKAWAIIITIILKLPNAGLHFNEVWKEASDLNIYLDSSSFCTPIIIGWYRKPGLFWTPGLYLCPDWPWIKTMGRMSPKWMMKMPVFRCKANYTSSGYIFSYFMLPMENMH